jgi:hypothetical protein
MRLPRLARGSLFTCFASSSVRGRFWTVNLLEKPLGVFCEPSAPLRGFEPPRLHQMNIEDRNGAKWAPSLAFSIVP